MSDGTKRGQLLDSEDYLHDMLGPIEDIEVGEGCLVFAERGKRIGIGHA
jgi:hypothetical protein